MAAPPLIGLKPAGVGTVTVEVVVVCSVTIEVRVVVDCMTEAVRSIVTVGVTVILFVAVLATVTP